MLSEYDQEIPQSHTAGRPKEHQKNIKVTQLALSLVFIKMIAKLEGHKVLNNETRTKHKTPHRQWEQQ